MTTTTSGRPSTFRPGIDLAAHGRPVRAIREIATRYYTGARMTHCTYSAVVVFADGHRVQCPHEGGHRSEDVLRRCCQKIVDAANAALDAAASTTRQEPQRVVADERDPSDACEAGTPGCCIDHTQDDGGCETW